PFSDAYNGCGRRADSGGAVALPALAESNEQTCRARRCSAVATGYQDQPATAGGTGASRGTETIGKSCAISVRQTAGHGSGGLRGASRTRQLLLRRPGRKTNRKW